MPTISNSNEANFVNAYGILCAALPKHQDRDGLYPTFCQIDPGKETQPHAHFEPELFYITEGSGQMVVEQTSATVKAGDLVRIPPFKDHRLQNTGSEKLCFLSVYAEDFETPSIPTDVIITAAPPTPNGPLHLGHISGPYLAADILGRYLALRQSNVLTYTGTDDHQNYVAVAARQQGLKPETFRQQMRSRIQQGLRNTGVAFTTIYEPAADSTYRERARSFFRRAVTSKIIQPESLSLPFCDTCNHFLRDALVSGTCPHCGHASSGGCEHCGLVVPVTDLLQPACNTCKTAASSRAGEVYTFSLHTHLPSTITKVNRLNLSHRIRQMIEHVSRIPTHKVIVSYPADASSSSEEIRVDGQALHVWFEMAAHYESYATTDRTWIHAFGFDNSFYYLLYIPSLLCALNPRAKIPYAVLTNQFLLLDGQKFSTSRRHAIWADDFRGNTEHLRLFLCLKRPQRTDEDFTLVDFLSFSKQMDHQISRLMSLTKMSPLQPKKIRRQQLIAANRLTRDFALFLSPEQFDSRRAAHRLIEFIDTVVSSDSAVDPLMIQALATLMQIFMPQAAQQLLETLNLQKSPWTHDWTVNS